ncbi:MAG TPA: nucleotide exchange factor GrpE [Pirellulales bacterium]|nr:nucleotide exchange factor GrpE [Pirellulales bacterium]
MAKPDPDTHAAQNARQRAAAEDVDQSATGDDAVPELTSDQEMDVVRADLSEARDKMLRAQAELDNYRKRARRELDDERRYAEINLLRDLLPVLDNIHRAVDAAEKKADPAALLSGFKMVRQQLEGLLEQHHCKTIEAVGEAFDPAQHNAVMQQAKPDKPENTVLDVVQTGYHLYDRVVRPAQVIVSKKE